MRWLLVGLTALLLLLQYRLWLAGGGIAEAVRLNARIEEQQILELQNGSRVIEQRAREDLGLVKEGEIYFQFTDGTSKREQP